MEKVRNDLDVIKELKELDAPVVFLCVGTDKHVWDSIGPMVGSLLKREKDNYIVIGDLFNPITALNVEMAQNYIRRTYPGYKIIAVDASITKDKELHKSYLFKDKGLRPGSGVDKSIAVVGDYSLVYLIHEGDILNNAIRNPFFAAVEIIELIKEIF